MLNLKPKARWIILPLVAATAILCSSALAPAAYAAVGQAKIHTVHGVLKSVDLAASTMVVTVTTKQKNAPAQTAEVKVTVPASASILVQGKTGKLSDYVVGDAITVRGNDTAVGLEAARVMDAETERLEKLTQTALTLSVKAVDEAAGMVTLESPDGNISLKVKKDRIKVGDTELGAATDLAAGQEYEARLTYAMDGKPDVVLMSPRVARQAAAGTGRASHKR